MSPYGIINPQSVNMQDRFLLFFYYMGLINVMKYVYTYLFFFKMVRQVEVKWANIPQVSEHMVLAMQDKQNLDCHYNDIIMSAIASQIPSLTIVYSIP